MDVGGRGEQKEVIFIVRHFTYANSSNPHYSSEKKNLVLYLFYRKGTRDYAICLLSHRREKAEIQMQFFFIPSALFLDSGSCYLDKDKEVL